LPKGIDGQAVASFNDHPYDIPHTLVDYAQRNTNVPVVSLVTLNAVVVVVLALIVLIR
jgi:hypothetical protein